MDQALIKEEEVIDLDNCLSRSSESEVVSDDVIEVIEFPKTGSLTIPKPIVVDTAPVAPVACHFFFPTANEDDFTLEDVEQQDPLALAPECVDSPPFLTELVTVDNELFNLENSQPESPTSFSLIDPLLIVESDRRKIKLEPSDELNDIKPTPEQLEECMEKRMCDIKSECESDYFPPSKKLKLGGNQDDSNIDLKKVVVNIGPKLPMPRCFQLRNKSNNNNTSKIDTTPELFSCEKCDLICQDNDELAVHMNEHIVVKIFTCSKCNHKCTDSASHEAHLRSCVINTVLNPSLHNSVARNGFYWCEICNFRFEDEGNLIIHENKHFIEKSFPCHICKMDFTTIDRLRIHSSDIHKNLTKVFSCNVCDYSTMYVSHLKDHMIKHTSDKHIYCYICKRNWDNEEDYNVHLGNVHKTNKARRRKQKNKIEETNTVENEKNENLSKLKSDIESEIIQKNGINVHKRTKARKRKQKNKIEETKTVEKKKNENLSKLKSDIESEIIQKNGIYVHKRTKARKRKQNNKIEETKTVENQKNENLSKLKLDFESEIIEKNGIFSCNGCEYKFLNLNNLIKHKNLHLKASKPYICSKCEYETFSIVKMEQHAKSHSLIKATCNVCGLSVKMWRSLRRHAVLHIYDGLYCSRCHINLEDTDSFQHHMSTVHKVFTPSVFKCSKCSFTHSISSVVKDHIKRHMKQENLLNLEKEQILTGMKKDDNVILQRKKVTFRNKDKSSETNERMSLSNDDTSHLKLESKENCKPLSCKICDLKFGSELTLSQHNKTHLPKQKESDEKVCEPKNNEWMYACNKCSFKCIDIISFERHDKLKHVTKKEPFTCNLCDYKSALLRAYIQHMSSHAGTSTFSCRYCPYDSNKEHNFVQHVLGHRLKCCPMCVFKTLRMRLFKEHVAKQHKSSSAPFSCTLCPYSCHSEIGLSIHTLKYHPNKFATMGLPIPQSLRVTEQNNSIKSHACSKCPFRSYRMYDLKRHVARHFVCGTLNGSNTNLKVDKKSSNINKSKNKPQATRKIIKPGDKIKKIVSKRKECLYYKCSQCEYKSIRRQSVYRHLLKLHNIIGRVRNNMVIKVISQTKLKETKHSGQSRKQNSTSNIQKRPPMKNCTKCNVHELSRSAQSDHTKHGHDKFWKKPLACQVQNCGARFINKWSFTRHEQSHQRGKLTCERCKVFNTHRTDILKKHLKICSGLNENNKGEKIKKLEVKSVNEKNTEAEEDEQQKSDDESYSCGECSYVTLDVTSLITHMFIHTGIPDD